MLASAAQAAPTTYVVNSSADDAPGGTCAPSPGTCTLRDALSSANAGSTASLIQFDPSLNGHTITLMNGALPLTHGGGMAIQGPGATELTVDAAGASQVFTVTGAAGAGNQDVISGLTIENGHTSSPGGAIDNTSSEVPLTLSDDVITGSTSTDGISGGGGVYSYGPLTLTRDTITGNHATAADGGGVSVGDFQPLTVNQSAISGNTALGGGGIGVSHKNIDSKYDQGGTAVITGSTISGNHAVGSSSGPAAAGGISGRFITLSVSGSTISDNDAALAGGGLTSLTKYGTTIDHSTITGNTTTGTSGNTYGGGIFSFSIPYKYSPVQISDSTISNNQAENGAGVDVWNLESGDRFTVQGSTLSGNRAGTHASYGGGLDVGGYVDGHVDLLDSTVSGNSAARGGGVGLGDYGGRKLFGKYGHGAPGSNNGAHGAISFENSTIASNSASSSNGGGGIYLGYYQYNSSSPKKSGTAAINSTVVSGNTSAGSAQDLARNAGSTSGGFNGAFSLIQTPGTAPLLSKNQVILGVNPQLGALANNGGPTRTMLPSGTSPLIDQGHAEQGLTTDQRGGPRTIQTSVPNPPGGDGTDIGAVELPASSVGSNFAVFIDRQALGGSTRPLIGGHATPVRCAVRVGTINSCTITLRVGNTVVGRGSATRSTAKRQVFLRVHPTSDGLKMLSKHPLGLKADALAVAGGTGPASVTGKVRLLAGPAFRLHTGSNGLSKRVRRELDVIASILTGVNTVKCKAIGSTAAAADTQAKAACKRLKDDGLKATYKTAARGGARTGSERLVISFLF